MKFLIYALVFISFNAIAMEDAHQEYCVQDLLDSKPNYQLIELSECTLASSPNSRKKFTRVNGIENVDCISKMYRINLDHNLIKQEGFPFAAIPDAKCGVVSLNSNCLTALIPIFFEGLKNLTQLELNNNCISQLPSHWGPLAQLEVLRLSKNSITHIPAGTFAELKNLMTLILDNNGLQEIHLTAGELPKLTVIRLKENFKGNYRNWRHAHLIEKIENDIVADRSKPFSYKHLYGYCGIPEDNLEDVVVIIDADEQP